ncbi:hypothetical protein HQ584_07300 [Patescibacteria group bacterium]|nr:hypothetical protein [Patescibacteria group bacterium]
MLRHLRKEEFLEAVVVGTAAAIFVADLASGSTCLAIPIATNLFIVSRFEVQRRRLMGGMGRGNEKLLRLR